VTDTTTTPKSAGLISLINAAMMPDGQLYYYIWHEDWMGHEAGLVAKVVDAHGQAHIIATFSAEQVISYIEMSRAELDAVVPVEPIYIF